MGFSGVLSKPIDSNDEFECRGRIDLKVRKQQRFQKQDFTSTQKYELQLVNVDARLTVLASSSNLHVTTLQFHSPSKGTHTDADASTFLLLVNSRINTETAEPIRLTCVAQVACRDVPYDIRFVIDDQPSDTYRTLYPDSPRCDRSTLVQAVNVSRTLIIDKWTEASWNGTSIRCEIHYGVGSDTVSTSSPNYALFFASL